jgi:hypothetical protein
VSSPIKKTIAKDGKVDETDLRFIEIDFLEKGADAKRIKTE